MKRCDARFAGLVLLGALMVLGSTWAMAEGDGKQVVEVKREKKVAKVAGPYGKLDLDEEQREKIAAIQKDIAEQIEALKRQEREQIMAVLSEEQRAKLHRTADHEKLQKRIWGMKGYLKRLENQRDALKEKAAGSDGEAKEKAEAKLAATEKKVADYKAKLAAEEAELRALEDKQE